MAGYEDGDASNDVLKDCFNNLADSISAGCKYYTESPKKCYHSSCPSGLYPESQTNGGYLCTNCQNSKISKGFCKNSCDNDECYFENDPNTNSENINSNICNSILTHFYYIITLSNQKICVDNCNSINKFYFEGNKQCQESCQKNRDGQPVYFYYNPTDNKCVEQCNDNNYIFAKNPTNNPEKCDLVCPEGYKYLVQNTHQCLDSCPNTHPYYFKDSNFDTNHHYICKPITSCSGSNYLFFESQCISPEMCKQNNNYFMILIIYV